MRLTSFGDCADAHRTRLAGTRWIALEAAPPTAQIPLQRIIDRFPFVPSDPATRSEHCRETYTLPCRALVRHPIVADLHVPFLDRSPGDSEKREGWEIVRIGRRRAA